MSSRWQCRCRYRSVRASRSFSLSHLGPRNTHASAPDALLSSLYPSFPRSTHAACSFHPPKAPLVSLLSVYPFVYQLSFLTSFRVVFIFSLSLALFKVPTYRRDHLFLFFPAFDLRNVYWNCAFRRRTDAYLFILLSLLDIFLLVVLIYVGHTCSIYVVQFLV